MFMGCRKDVCWGQDGVPGSEFTWKKKNTDIYMPITVQSNHDSWEWED